MKFLNFYLLIATALVLTSCTRPMSDGISSSSRVSFVIPVGLGAQGVALPTDKKACYGVKVTGPGIVPMPQQCGANLGIYSGFVAEGGSLTVDVPKGDSRTFELVINLVGLNDACPNWDESFGATTNQLQSTYVAGKTENVKIDQAEHTVMINLDFPGVANSVNLTQGLVGCTSKMKGMLYSNGDVENASGQLLSGSSEINEGFYSTSIGSDIFGVGFITSGGILNIGSASPVEIPPYVYSVTRKPDSGTMYGLVGDGKIVSISLSGGTASVTELSSSNCPFSVTNCKVPEWMQSISAGFSTELYGLDHGGNIYQLGAGGVATQTGDSVPESVTQVSYF
jgi:hypothetical protein